MIRFLVISLLAIPSLGAIPQREEVAASLRGKPQQRWDYLKKTGKEGIRQLRQIAFGQHYTVEQRWKALSTLAMISGRECEPELEQALQHSEWFMRDAGLKSLEKINSTKAKKWAKRLLNDPSLVVRSSAVKVIENLHDMSAKTVLWEKLNSAQNYRGAQSLWVRHHIVGALSKFADKGEEVKFIQILNDKDQRLHKPATEALRRLTGLSPDVQTKNLVAEVSYWKNWWAKR